MKTCAIIIPVYDMPEFILTCIDAIKRQITIPADWKIEVRIGVDGCAKTAAVLQQNKIPYFWSEKNVGAYVMRNSLIYYKQADAYALFDADDTMRTYYMQSVLSAIDAGHKIVVGAQQQVNTRNQRLYNHRKIINGGAYTFTHDVLVRLGGFHPLRVSADSDFLQRATQAGYEIKKLTHKVYFTRCRHMKSLTKAKKTNWQSKYRLDCREWMRQYRERQGIHVNPATTPLIYIP